MDVKSLLNSKIKTIGVTHGEIFSGNAMAQHLRNVISIPCGKIRRVVPTVKVMYERKSEITACTDGKQIVINAAMKLLPEGATLKRKMLLTLGLLAHEFGHYRFSDFVLSERLREEVKKTGKLYPAMNIADYDGDFADNLKDMEDTMANDSLVVQSFLTLRHQIDNIVEDGYIEEALFQTMNGQLMDGLAFLRYLQYKKVKNANIIEKDFRKLPAEKQTDDMVLNITMQFLLDYARYGLVKGKKSMSVAGFPPADYFRKLIPYASKFLKERHPEARAYYVNCMMVVLWKLIKPMLFNSERLEQLVQKIEDMMDSAGEAPKGNTKSIEVSLEELEAMVEQSEASQKRDETDAQTGAESVSVILPKEVEERLKKKDDAEKNRQAQKQPNKKNTSDKADGDSAQSGNSGKEDGTEDSDSAQSGRSGKEDGTEDSDSSQSGNSGKEDGTEDSDSSQSGNSGKEDGTEDSDSSQSGRSGKEDGTEGSDSAQSGNSGKEDGTEDGDGSQSGHSGKEDGTKGDAAKDGNLNAGNSSEQKATTSAKGISTENACNIPCGGVTTYEEDIEPQADWDAIQGALSRIEKDLRKEKAEDAVNDAICEQMQAEANSLPLGNAHKGVSFSITRTKRPGNVEKELYNKFGRTYEKLADEMFRKVKHILQKDETNDIMLGGSFSGMRFDASRLVYNDYLYFKNVPSPLPNVKTAFSIVVDMSGSMWGEKIEMARVAALTFHLFCKKAEMRHSIIGHTTQNNNRDVYIESFTDYDTPDELDYLRLLHIEANNANRDGAAIALAGERLLQQEEPTKVMLVITDGRPNAMGYGGAMATQDVYDTVQTLRRRGVVVLAAAIDEDKDLISEIYGDGFIDIQNLEEMPKTMLQLLQRYIRR